MVGEGNRMPRPTKRIEPGSLTDPVVAARSSVWRKHASPEHAAQYEPDGAILVDALTHETVAHVDLTEVSKPTVSLVEDVPPPAPEVQPTISFVWTSERTIDGRTYRRSDALIPESEASESV